MITHPVLPHVRLQDVFAGMAEDYRAHDPANGAVYIRATEDFPRYVRRLLDDERGIDLPQGRVPCSHRWLFNEAGDCVATVNVRHHIASEFLREEAGHIGYDVAPSSRGQGYGVDCLRAGFVVAKELGLERALLYAATDNPASWKTIEKCGGILDAERYSAHFQVLVRRYWLTIL